MTHSHSVTSIIRKILILMLAMHACSCASRPPRENVPDISSRVPAFAEPDNYSATIIQTIDDGDRHEVIETRVARSGEMFREEWREGGELRAAISRPDLGKIFLLSIDRQLFVETSNDLKAAAEAMPTGLGENAPWNPASCDEPETVEVTLLPESAIDGHVCTAVERKAVFADRHSELTRIYSAKDLGGLFLRMKSESSSFDRASHKTVLVERKNVKTNVSDTEFTVPSNYKRAGSL